MPHGVLVQVQSRAPKESLDGSFESFFLWNNRVEWAQVMRSNFLKLLSTRISLDIKRENNLL